MKNTENAVFTVTKYTQEISIPCGDTIRIPAPISAGDSTIADKCATLEESRNAMEKHGCTFSIRWMEGNAFDYLLLEQYAVDRLGADGAVENFGCQGFPEIFTFGHGSQYTTCFHMGGGEYFPLKAVEEYTVRAAHVDEYGETVYGEDINWKVNTYEELKNLIEEAK